MVNELNVGRFRMRIKTDQGYSLESTCPFRYYKDTNVFRLRERGYKITMLSITKQKILQISFLGPYMASSQKTKFEMAVIDKVTEMRRKRNLSQDDIAIILGLTRGFIGQIESPNNPSTYNLNHLNRLAYEFGCSPQDFLPGKPVLEPGWE
jgi:DNA-binding XRE family transcriptional regulator